MAFLRRQPARSRSLGLETLESRDLLTVSMTLQEQLLIELVNRARANPEAEARRLGIELNDGVEEDELISAEPKQPLAPHQALTEAAGLHSQDMLDRDFFGHDTPDGVTPSDGARAAGYPAGAGENIAWHGDSRAIDRDREVYQRHEDLVLSVGHRVNMMRDNWREIGAGVRYGIFTQVQDGRAQNFNSIMVGTLFGSRGGNHFITGVVISDDVVANRFYEIGEGLGGVTVTAVGSASGDTFTDVSGPTGGYALQVPAGAYSVTASGGSLQAPITVAAVVVTDANRKIDFNTREMPTSGIRGVVYHDRDQDRQHDADEPVLANRVVYLDLNENQRRDAEEPVAETTGAGTFEFRDLWPGEYLVEQELPPGWRQTTPTGTLLATLGGLDDADTVEFGSFTNLPWHNAARPQDVNDDGFVVSQDALIVIRQLNRNRSSSLADHGLDSAPPYLDVNGDGFLTSLDALDIIRELNRRSALRSSAIVAAARPLSVSSAASAQTRDATFSAWEDGEDEDGEPAVPHLDLTRHVQLGRR